MKGAKKYYLLILILTASLMFVQAQDISRTGIFRAGRAIGDDCTQPVMINIPDDLPYIETGQTTCGHGNVYEGTCMGNYDGGEDIIYQLNVNIEITVSITMTPDDAWTGMGLFDDCPDVGACLSTINYSNVGYVIVPMQITYTLSPGIYFMMMDSWPSPVCYNFDLSIDQIDPVNYFPYEADFEDGLIPTEFAVSPGEDADVRIDNDAASASSYGLLFEGNTSENWGFTPTNVSQAFDPSKSSHFGTVNIEVDPDTMQSGTLKMSFDLRQGYSYDVNYCWFRVMVNGSTIPDENGYTYYQPATHNDPFINRIWDLSAYQAQPGLFTIILQSSCKYYENYYQQGDVVHIDNFIIWYELPPGSVEGYVFNGDGLTIAAATVGIEGIGAAISGPDGYYFLDNIPSGYQNVTAWKQGYNPVTHIVYIPSGGLAYHDFILTQPTIFISPTFHDYTLHPNEYLTTQTGILNMGDGPLDWEAEVVYPPTELNVLKEEPRTETPDPNADYSLMVRTIQQVNPLRNTWDVQFTFPVAVGGGEAGVESDGNYIYSTKWNGASFYKYELDGTYVGEFQIQGVFNVRDLAYNGTYFYGGAISTTVYIMNFNSQTLIGTLTVPGPVRAIAYDDDVDGFYVNNWSTDIILFDRQTGAFISSFPVGSYGNYFGFAYDNWSDGGPYLWGYSQDGSGGELVQIQLPSGTETGFVLNTFTATGVGIPGVDIAGGLFTQPGIVPDLVTIGGMMQNSYIWGMELAECGPPNWLSLDFYSGTVPPGGGLVNIPTNFNASGTNSCEVYTADIVFTSNPDVGTVIIPCTMTVLGDPLSPPCDLEISLTNEITGQVELNWTWTSREFQYFLVKRDGVVIGSTTNTFYTDFLPGYGEYCYTVQAYYDEGMTVPAGPECLLWPNPTINIDPDSLEAWIWVDNQTVVSTTIYNMGIGTLSYIFPAFVETDDTKAYCSGSGGCDEYIANVTIGSINNSSGCTNYGDYTNLSTIVQSGNIYPVSITIGNPYSGDIAGIWVDWDQDEDWTDETMIQTSGSPGAGFTAQIEPPDDALTGTTRMRIRLQWGGTLAPCGTTPYGEVEDYTLFVIGGFIVDVQPAEGIIPEGGSQDIIITYDAVGFPPGDFNQQLLCESNDPGNPEVYINNIMHVYVPAQFAGTVTDGNTGLPVAGAAIIAGAFQTFTSSNGAYELYVDEGTYEIVFEKLGYQTVIVADTFAQQGIVTTVDILMFEQPYPPAWVTATVNEDDTECLVEWSLPAGPYEILYDDGEAEELVLWAFAGNENAVRFTPPGYPATVTGGRLFVGDGSFPAGNWFGSEFAILVYDDDGTDGLPGTRLDSIGVLVNNFGWVEFWGTNATVYDGDFYLSMVQLNPAPNAAPLGVDYTTPTVYRSYSKISGTEWILSVYQDFMIRAYVEGPTSSEIVADGITMMYPSKIPAGADENIFFSKNRTRPDGLPGVVKGGDIRPVTKGVKANRDVTGYNIARISDFDPNIGPEFGIMTTIAINVTGLEYNDIAYGGLAQGWYAYAVRAKYTNGDISVWTYSNIVGHLKEVAITFEVSLSTGDVPENVEITIAGEEWPYQVYFGITDTTGILTFDPVWKGIYRITAFKVGYELYEIPNENLQSDMTYQILLMEKRYPPCNLWVDPLTSWAYWDWPLVTALVEDFEGIAFPPVGWQALSKGAGWFLTTNGNSPNWIIPPWDSQYACSNDDAAGSTNNGCCDYLVTLPLDLRETDAYSLMFDSYYDGAYGQLAFVEYSYDAGATWEVLYAVPPMPGSWDFIDLDLSAYSGISAQHPIWFAFHADDAGLWASGWALDNVEVSNGAANPIDFHLFLDGAFVSSSDTLVYQYRWLTYGVTYEASVAARYTSGLSDNICYTFISQYLIPPRNLNGLTFDDAVELWWEPPLEPITLYEVLSEGPRVKMPDTNAEYSPTIRTIAISGNGAGRDLWDVHFNFPVAVGGGEAGLETDGEFIYSTKWNGPGFYKYQLDGTYMGEFQIAGANEIRDLAYEPDEGYMYGSAASTTVYIMDFINQVLIGQFIAPTEVRAIAYDEDIIGFWANNWETDITLFDKNGVYIKSFPVGAFGSYYGFAYDPWTEGGPYLWGFSQDGSGAILVMIEIATGIEMFNINVLPLVGGTQIAGGLFTECGLIYDDVVTIGGMLQNELIFGLELGPCQGHGNWQVPDNLVGYYIYRDYENIAYLPYDGEDTTYFLDTGLEPLTYEYDVTALYDLSPYGFPGDTGESMMEGPFLIPVQYGHPLPFEEYWTSGSFELNQWTHGQNWRVHGHVGNPKPSSEFTWDPILTNYKSALYSYPLDGINLNDPFIDGCIWFDFDVKLDDRNMTGTEKLSVEVGNEDGWHKLIEYNNADSSFDWTSYHFNISPWAFRNIFRIRFVAGGTNSSNILSWFVDNIMVYRTCSAPRNLSVEQQNCVDLYLEWNSPFVCGGGGYGDMITPDAELSEEAGEVISSPSDANRALQGYNIYLFGEFLDFTADTNYLYVVSENGTYSFEVTAVYEDCESDTAAGPLSIDVGCVGIEELLADGNIAIFPNPAREVVNIVSTDDITYVTMLNNIGQVVCNKKGVNGNVLEINVTGFEAGIYMIKIETAGNIITGKVLITH